ncbi:MAG: hypothetical protein H0U17_05275 [Actinobacteria bacterium]|nr:hypothetical protein [Actinomycetota bacterium]
MHVAVVSADPTTRLEAARAFDDAPPEWSVTLHTTAPPDADVVVLGPDAEGDGIPFDPEDPTRVIEEIRARAAGARGAVLVVASASGGVGATSLALHLAAAVAPVCAVGYLDLSNGAGARLGLTPGEHLSWADLDEGDDSIARCALPVEAGFRALIAPERHDEGEDVVLKRARAAFDLLVVDAPHPACNLALPEADVAVLVLTPSVPQAARASALLECWPTLDWAVVANRIGPGGETTSAQLADLVGRRVALELPCSSALRDAEDDGRLLSLRWTRYGRAVGRLAGALVIT